MTVTWLIAPSLTPVQTPSLAPVLSRRPPISHQAAALGGLLFAGHELGAENWAALASLIEICKLNGRNPQAYLADVLRLIVERSDADSIDDLLPYNWVDRRPAQTSELAAQAA